MSRRFRKITARFHKAEPSQTPIAPPESNQAPAEVAPQPKETLSAKTEPQTVVSSTETKA